MDQQTIERFWSKVKIGEPGECWPWNIRCVAGRKGQKYGNFFVGRGKCFYAHRLAWEFTNGPIPAGKIVCHKCDNPLCCNPDHLFIGTYRDNTQDMIRKGRAFLKVGQASLNAKLNDDDVVSLVRFYMRGLATMGDLSRVYGVSVATISNVIHGKSYQNIKRPVMVGNRWNAHFSA